MTSVRFWPRLLFLTVLVLGSSVAGRAATLTLVNNDFPNEGFNDSTPRDPVTGNSGTTLGQQRLNAFEAAAQVFAQLLDSDVTIRILAEMNDLDCSEEGAVLGGAGPEDVIRDFPNAPKPSTFYPVALANSLAGTDLEPGFDDVGAEFNSALDTGCLDGVSWWYGLGVSPPANTVDFSNTVLHELAHGLGFLTVVDETTGEKMFGFDDTYMTNLEDHSTGRLWPQMTDNERATSATDTGDLHWVGSRVVAQSGVLSAGVHPTGHVQMYAPDEFEFGSSVSHWDTELVPNELMEPFDTGDSMDLITTQLLEDVGWQLITGGGNGGNGNACTPGGTTLCIDVEPDDGRFKVTLSYESLPRGVSGNGGTTPLASLGITRGGIISFNDPSNPEVLVKVINGCGITNHFWVFYAATTDVGFTLTVEDTQAEVEKVYSNPDMMAAQTVTDTAAFATCP